MKIKNLTLAVLTGLSLTACGVSSDNDAVDNSTNNNNNDNTPAAVCGLEHPDACKTAEEKEKLKKLQQAEADKNKQPDATTGKPATTGDTNGNATVKIGIGEMGVNENETPANTTVADAGKKSTVGVAQYVRNEGSEIDQVNNPSKRHTPNSGSYVYSIPLNAKVENFVAAQTLADQPFADNATEDHGTYGVTYYLGHYDNDAYSKTVGAPAPGTSNSNWNSSANDFRSLQELNEPNINLIGSLSAASPRSMLVVHTNSAGEYFFRTLLNTQIDGTQADALKGGTPEAGGYTPYYSMKNAQGIYNNYKDAAHTSAQITGQQGNIYHEGSEETKFVKSGLIYEGVTKQNGGIIGGDDAKDSIADTRIFGHLFNSATDTDDTVNSYERAEVTKSTINGQPDGFHGIAVLPMHLDYVQYGRVTGNFNLQNGDDKLNWTDIGTHLARNGILYKHADTIGRQDNNGLSWYFSRGVNATKIKDGKMDLQEGEGVLNYAGHAVTYGFNTSVLAGGAHPNAMGGATDIAVGDFVQAKFDVKNSNVTGSIYRFALPNPKDPKTAKQVSLVSFNGQVLGNTVTGTSLNQITSDAKMKQGTFHANFFGPAANELGGSVNAVKDDAYGPGKAWGAVFGAKTTVTPVKSNVFTDLEDDGK